VSLQPAPTSECEVRAVESRSDLRAFKGLPRTICGSSPHWVEPLKIMTNWILNRRRHPFYSRGKSAEAEFFLARDTAHRPVGRIAAIINHTYDEHVQQDNGEQQTSGFFGFFDCIDSQEVADALLQAAVDWVRRRGATQMLGPASPSQAYEYGLLVEGHDLPHRFLLGYNPPYYEDLLTNAGLVKARDLLSLSMDLSDPQNREPIDQFFALSDAAAAALPRDVTIRSGDERRLKAEVFTAVKLLNRVFSEHWGYSPVTDGELRYMARSLRAFLIPDLILFAEQDDEAIGIALGVPDLNEIIRKLKVRIGWIEPLELLIRARRWRARCVRVVAVGVSPGYDRAGVALGMVGQLGRNVFRCGIEQVEAHLVLEDNHAILNPLHRYGFRPIRKHRIYRCDL